jgi:hypothetical protein
MFSTSFWSCDNQISGATASVIAFVIGGFIVGSGTPGFHIAFSQALLHFWVET